MSGSTVQKRVLEAVESLPPDASIEDAMERLYFLAKIERGLAEADAGQGIPHGEVRKRLGL
jgi:predicted transcriptional regulator